VEDRFPRVADAYLVKRDGVVIWAGNPQLRMAPASLTASAQITVKLPLLP